MGFQNFIEKRKNVINLIISIYLWGFALSFLLTISSIAVPEIWSPSVSPNISIASIVFNLINLLISFFVFTSFIGIPIILLIYKKANKINAKIFEKNKISFTLEKYFTYGILVMFFLVLPTTLTAIFFIIGKYSLVYYFAIILSTLAPLVFIHVCIIIYNIITNLKQKERWKKFAINLFLYIVLAFYVDRLIVLLMKTL